MSQGVKLYVYDLTRGMAAQLGPALLGRPLEGIWHTALVAYGTEFFFSGGGIERAQPASTPFGTPTRIVDLGQTEIPLDLFESYLLEIQPQFRFGTYHLLDHNCNTFTNTVSQFLVGHGIPSDIVSMPSDLINSPIGRMLLPYIEQMYGPSAVAQSSAPAQLPFPQAFPSSQTSAPANSTVQYGIVNEITSPLDLTAAIQSKPAVVVDFTSPRCGPCVQIAPYYAQLATYVNNVIFVSVNTLQSGLVAMQWNVSATPTFLFFHNGQKTFELKGANKSVLETKIFELSALVKNSAAPSHPHELLSVPTIKAAAPALMTQGNPPAVVQKLKQFLTANGDASVATDRWDVLEKVLVSIVQQPSSSVMSTSDFAIILPLAGSLLTRLQPEQQFPVLDIWRLLILDRNVSTNLTTVNAEVIPTMIKTFTGPTSVATTKMMALRVACNLFAHTSSQGYIVGATCKSAIVDAIVAGLLGTEANVRETAAALAYNLSIVLPKEDTDATVEVVSAVQHAVQTETSSECIFRLLAALGHFAYANDDIVALLQGLETGLLLTRLAQDPSILQKTKALIAELVQLV